MDAQGCRAWSEVTACASTEICDQGTCRKNCLDNCGAGTSLCTTAGVRSCVAQPSGCHDWGSAQPCSPTQVCSGGACVDACQNQCSENAKQCSGNGFVTCVKQGSSCTEWVNPTPCPAGQVCSGGACVPNGQCQNQCAAWATRCGATGLQQKCLTLPSGCTDWSLPAACPQGQSCPSSGNACLALPCKAGDKRCAGNYVETCDMAANWVVTQACPQACASGACTTSASCTPGAVRCNGSNVEICNSSGTAWLYNLTCNLGCAGGVCTDPCTAGTNRCNGSTVETCADGGTGWVSGQTCGTACFQGGCIAADLLVDGVTQTLEGEQVFQNSVIVRNGGQIKVGVSGALRLRAKTISVDSASSIVASGVGTETRGSGSTSCSSGYGTDYTVHGGASYGTQGSAQYSSSYHCYAYPGPIYDSDSDLSISQGSKQGSNLGGGLVTLRADSVSIAGQVVSNGSGSGSGGGILIAADTISGNGAIQAVGGGGSPSGGHGRIKLLRGSTNSFSGSLTAQVSQSIMPPLDLVSGSHPDPATWYNDGLGDWFIAWSRPFPTVNGYYYKISASPSGVPGPSNGTFLQAESFRVPAASLQTGANYFHISAVDSAANVGSVENVLKVQVNSAPPSISSSSHPSQRTWYQNNAIYLSWTNPKADSNFTGFYYLFDHYADTVPAATAGTFTTNKQILMSNVTGGIWVFHLVNRDTRGATTKAAAHFIVYVGTAPGQGNLSGSVFDGSNGNAPLSGVEIKVNRGLFSTQSASGGTYTFSNSLYEGTWEVIASKPLYQPQTKTVAVTAGQVTNQNFTLTKLPLSSPP